jgi:polyisoprenoid-binding protein YceI
MKKFLLLTLLLAFHTVNAQKYFTKTGETSFKASVDTFEPIEATSLNTTVLLDVATGEVAALIFVNSFQFEIALMQEHFNENYMNTAEFPKAYFEGNIENFDIDNLREKTTYDLVGSLTIKGEQQSFNSQVTLKKVNNSLHVNSSFALKAENFNVEIPSIVRKKIAERILVDLNYVLHEK